MNTILSYISQIFQKIFIPILLWMFLLTGTNSIFAEEVNIEENSEEQNVETQNLVSEDNEEPQEEETFEIKKSDNEAIQILRDRQAKIQESLEKSDEEKKIEQSEDDLSEVQAEKENLNEVTEEIKNELKTLQAELSVQQGKEQSLKTSLQKEQEKNSVSQESLKNLESEISDLEKKIQIKNSVLLKNAEDLDALSQEEELKKAFLEQSVKLKKQLEEKESEEISEKFSIFFGVTGFFILLSLLRIFIAKKLNTDKKLKKKHTPKLAVLDVLSLIFYIGFLVWFFFYIKPELVVYLLFLVGAMVMVLQEYIFSMISSVFIVQRYSIGDRIRFEKQEGIIEKLTLLKVQMRDIDSRGVDLSKTRVVPNSLFMKGVVSILPRHEIERFNFQIILPNDLSINEPALIQRIEENVLQKSITVKSVNEICETECFYDIDFTFSSTGHPIIELSWHETRAKSNRIKRKILAELEIVKRESREKKDIKHDEKIKKNKDDYPENTTGNITGNNDSE